MIVKTDRRKEEIRHNPINVMPSFNPVHGKTHTV